MHNPLSAQVIVNITPNPEQGRVEYIVCTHEGESSGINQLAEKLQQSVMAALPKCATPTGAE
ncbi:hypothetical protein [Vibrio sp. LaRot3]|uniref:hypothetical protein n=1 Tax=Vibrio sp. LaRot3 TaxID=2998829 RepID=UPI0022CDCF48|nr:hypothetical protein [Vibrio sp. LaRot3]MDA0148826.1 hypothetical protein [Vibrio sp. LaRot3]